MKMRLTVEAATHCKDCAEEVKAFLICGPLGTPYYPREPVCDAHARVYGARNITVRYLDGCTDALGRGHPRHTKPKETPIRLSR